MPERLHGNDEFRVVEAVRQALFSLSLFGDLNATLLPSQKRPSSESLR
jgi:hypothetical protein